MAGQVFTHDKKECCLFYGGASPHTSGVYRFLEYRMGRKKGSATCPAHPYILLTRRLDRSPALHCLPDRLEQCIIWILKNNNNFKNGMKEDRKMNLSSRSLETSKIIVGGPQF